MLKPFLKLKHFLLENTNTTCIFLHLKVIDYYDASSKLLRFRFIRNLLMLIMSALNKMKIILAGE